MPKKSKYKPRCSICQYLKNNPEVKLRLMDSTYFNPGGTETVLEAFAAFQAPFKRQNIYQHLLRHQKEDRTIALAKNMKEQLPEIEVLEGEVQSSSKHEQALDLLIQKGKEKLIMGDMQITAAHMIQAARVKADIEKSTKDRRLEAAKAFFANGNLAGQREITQ